MSRVAAVAVYISKETSENTHWRYGGVSIRMFQNHVFVTSLNLKTLEL